MKLVEQLNRLERIDQLIRLKATGSPKKLAKRMNISERTVYYLIDSLRDFGAEIKYCRDKASYYYCNEVKFKFKILLQK